MNRRRFLTNVGLLTGAAACDEFERLTWVRRLFPSAPVLSERASLALASIRDLGRSHVHCVPEAVLAELVTKVPGCKAAVDLSPSVLPDVLSARAGSVEGIMVFTELHIEMPQPTAMTMYLKATVRDPWTRVSVAQYLDAQGIRRMTTHSMSIVQS